MGTSTEKSRNAMHIYPIYFIVDGQCDNMLMETATTIDEVESKLSKYYEKVAHFLPDTHLHKTSVGKNGEIFVEVTKQ